MVFAGNLDIKGEASAVPAVLKFWFIILNRAAPDIEADDWHPTVL